ncbi:hypothetical protein Tcan_16267, partial [Toxocara canis]
NVWTAVETREFGLTGAAEWKEYRQFRHKFSKVENEHPSNVSRLNLARRFACHEHLLSEGTIGYEREVAVMLPTAHEESPPMLVCTLIALTMPALKINAPRRSPSSTETSLIMLAQA